MQIHMYKPYYADFSGIWLEVQPKNSSLSLLPLLYMCLIKPELLITAK